MRAVARGGDGMTKLPWWRFSSRVPDDPKIAALSDALYRTWTYLLCIAAKHDGVIPDDMGELAFTLRKAPAVIKQQMLDLHRAGLLERIDGKVRPHDWADWQYLGAGKKPGVATVYIYVVGASFSVVKLGCSQNPWARVGELQADTTEKLRVLRAFRGTAQTTDAEIHGLLSEFCEDGEWFNLPPHVVDLLSNTTKGTTYEAVVAKLRTLLRSEKLRRTTTETDTETEEGESPAATPLPARKRSRPRGNATRIPIEFIPDAAAARSLGMSDAEILIEAGRFVDHFRSVPNSAGGLKVDWPATWRNWCRRRTNPGVQPNGKHPSNGHAGRGGRESSNAALLGTLVAGATAGADVGGGQADAGVGVPDEPGAGEDPRARAIDLEPAAFRRTK